MELSRASAASRCQVQVSNVSMQVLIIGFEYICRVYLYQVQVSITGMLHAGASNTGVLSKGASSTEVLNN